MTEKEFRKARTELYEQLAKALHQVGKISLEIQQCEYEMRQRDMTVARVRWRPMVEVPMEIEMESP